jgi:hypothetical protein
MARGYQFHAHDPYPRRERQVVITNPVVSAPIPRFIFKPDELTWIDGWIADRMAQPQTWLDTWSELLSLRRMAVRPDYVRASASGWSYSSKFLAWFSIQHAVMTMTLLPANRPALAAEFRRHPFETEIIRTNTFTASVVAGVLAENGGRWPGAAATLPADLLVRCRYCTMTYKQGEPRCTNCGAIN